MRNDGRPMGGRRGRASARKPKSPEWVKQFALDDEQTTDKDPRMFGWGSETRRRTRLMGTNDVGEEEDADEEDVELGDTDEYDDDAEDDDEDHEDDDTEEDEEKDEEADADEDEEKDGGGRIGG
eukprot:5038721-Pyramimonas_sp.AAC.1